jgi:hypothetical protein
MGGRPRTEVKIRLELWSETKEKKTLIGYSSREVPDGLQITNLMRDILFNEWMDAALKTDEHRISDRQHD